jgi:hypothetical protein
MASINVLRCLADALVWSVVEYDRAKLTCIGDGRLVRRLADPGGRSAEFDRLHQLEHEGAVVVHADLTTHVRHGDLLVAPSWVPRSFHLEGFLAEVLVIDSLEGGFSAADHNAEFMDQHGIAAEDALVAATTHRRLRDRKYTFSGQLPLSLLPYQPSHVAGLLTGRLEVVLSCDARALEARFAAAGMTVEVHRAKDWRDAS